MERRGKYRNAYQQAYKMVQSLMLALKTEEKMKKLNKVEYEYKRRKTWSMYLVTYSLLRNFDMFHACATQNVMVSEHAIVSSVIMISLSPLTNCLYTR